MKQGTRKHQRQEDSTNNRPPAQETVAGFDPSDLFPDEPNQFKISGKLSDHYPLRFLVTTTLAVFVAEALIMVLLENIPHLGLWQTVILDASLITAFVLPWLYLILFKPLIKDIQARKETESALRTSEWRCRQITETAMEGIWVIDGHRKTVFASEQISQLLGYSPEEMIGLSIVDCIFEEDIPAADRIDQRRRNGVSESQDFRFRCKDGSAVWALVSYKPISDGRGKMTGVLAMVTDITERKLAEEALRESEERFRRVFEDSSQGMAVLGPDFKLSQVNYKLCVMLGYTEDDLLGRSISEFAHPEDVELGSHMFDQMLRGDMTSFNAEKRFYRRDGDIVWVNYTVSLIRDKNGKALHTLCSMEDITERKRMEEELFRAEKHESLGVLAGGIAHDFNNFLTAIMGNLSIISLEAEPESEIAVSVDAAEQAVSLAQRLTSQLLTFSRGDKTSIETVAVENILTDAAGFASRGSNVKCEFDIAEDLRPVDVDVDQILQVFHNIVVNAVQAMPDGGTIKISVANHRLTKDDDSPLDPGDYLLLEIQDEGKGISEENLPRIFDPYFTTKDSGTGLGLAISYSIIRKHDGVLRVQSELGVGTSFHIYLPASKGEISKTPRPALVSHSGTGRVLVMDDEDLVRLTAARILSRCGYEAVEAADGKEACQLYADALKEGKRFDLALLDLTVHGGQGALDIMPELLKLDPDLKAVVSSGYPDNSVMVDYEKHGFAAAIVKPYHASELCQTVGAVLIGPTEETVA